ncbi:hypothetical protein [Cohnella abietis]|uniref:hypothetical protein n=1 Tax=Cohnella abietis TaxID=2507935 RepID=UPI00102E2D4B|nr:hypothetical protein [Cohnella abietis]
MAYSLHEQSLRPLLGRAVCVIMNDKTRYTGVLAFCESSSIVLNGERSQRPVKRSRKAHIHSDEQVSVEQQHYPTSAYWGILSLGPTLSANSVSVKAVIPISPRLQLHSALIHS